MRKTRVKYLRTMFAKIVEEEKIIETEQNKFWRKVKKNWTRNKLK